VNTFYLSCEYISYKLTYESLMPHYLVEIEVPISSLDVNKMSGDSRLCETCCVLACPHGDEHGMLLCERHYRQLT
jgi:hypothetical protein